MGQFSFERYKEVMNNPDPKIYKAKLTDDLEVIAKIYRDGQVTLRAVYKGSNYETSFDEKKWAIIIDIGIAKPKQQNIIIL